MAINSTSHSDITAGIEKLGEKTHCLCIPHLW